MPIYSIGILAKGIYPNSELYYHYGTLRNQAWELLDNQIVYIIIIEIDKFNKQESELESDLDKLIFLMKHLHKVESKDQLPPFLDEEWLESALEKLDKMQMGSEQRMLYEMAISRKVAIAERLRREREEAIKEGVEKAVEEAVEKAVEKAVEEATEKATKKATENTTRQITEITARKMKSRGMKIDLIAEITGLSPAEIKNL